MLITITFNEINEIISNKTNNRLNLNISYVQRDCIGISYKPVAFLPATINVKVQIKEIGNSKIILSYNANGAIDRVIKGFSAYLDNHIHREILELDTSNQLVSIYPDKIEKIQKVLEMIELQQVYFEEGKVCAEVRFK